MDRCSVSNTTVSSLGWKAKSCEVDFSETGFFCLSERLGPIPRPPLLSELANSKALYQKNGLQHAKSLRIDLFFSMFCQRCRANPLVQLMALADSPGHSSCAHFGIRHFSGGKRVRETLAYAYLSCGRVASQGAPVKGFPTVQEIEKADKEQLARWYRFLPSGENSADQKIMKRIAERFEKLGGMTPELSKKIGM